MLTVGTDTYISLADADTYWSEHYSSAEWDAADEGDKEKALRSATQYVDKHYTWIGSHPGSESQKLSWPRLNAVDKQGRTITGIPQEVEHATAYLAQEELRGGILRAKSRGGAIKAVQAGSVNVEFEDNAPVHTSYDYVDLILSNLTKGGRGTVPLKKA